MRSAFEPLLYIETNFAIAVAKGQAPDLAQLLNSGSRAVRLVIPGVCFMEASSVFHFESRQAAKFRDGLAAQAAEVRRDVGSQAAPSLLHHLEQAVIDAKSHSFEFETRLYETLDRLSHEAELVGIDFATIQDCLQNNFLGAFNLPRDPTDNLILGSILRHARAHPEPRKAFLSFNSRDFGTPAAAANLRAAGVRYFKQASAALGWLTAPPPGPPSV